MNYIEAKTVYVSGPMSGMWRFNIPAFDERAKELRDAGYTVVSPAELDDPAFRDLCMSCETGSMEDLRKLCAIAGIEPETWGSLLARDVKLLADDGIEAIVVLPGWSGSRGAVLETMVARLCGLPICRVEYGSMTGQVLLVELAPRELQAAHAKATSAESVNIDDVLQDFPPLHTSPSLIAQSDEGAEARTVTLSDSVLADAGGRLEQDAQAALDLLDGEVRTRNETTGGEKGAKPEAYNLLPWDELDEVARLYHRGAQKYEPDNWKRGYDWSLSFSSLIRHVTAFWRGESLDSETKCHHLASVAFHALTLMYFEKHHPELDDRRVG